MVANDSGGAREEARRLEKLSLPEKVMTGRADAASSACVSRRCEAASMLRLVPWPAMRMTGRLANEPYCRQHGHAGGGGC